MADYGTINVCFVHSEHCIAEYNGDAVVLYPKAAMCSVDGIPITEPTRLPQGTKCLCSGIFNYIHRVDYSTLIGV